MVASLLTSNAVTPAVPGMESATSRLGLQPLSRPQVPRKPDNRRKRRKDQKAAGLTGLLFEEASRKDRAPQRASDRLSDASQVSIRGASGTSAVKEHTKSSMHSRLAIQDRHGTKLRG